MDLSKKTAFELSELYRKSACAPDETLRFLTESIQRTDGRLKAYIKFDPKKAKRGKAERGSRLWGVPVAVKDNICVEGE